MEPVPITAKRVVFFNSSCSKVTLYIISYSKIENRYNGQHFTTKKLHAARKFYTKESLFKVSLINDECITASGSESHQLLAA